MKEPRVVESIANECQSLGRAHESSSARAEQLIACLEGEIAKRDEELAACRIAVENCELFRARIAELEARIVWLECEAQGDAWAPSVNDYDHSIHSNPDAKEWADFFVATFPGLADKHDLMIGWFANAMMAMHDHLARKAQGVVMPEQDGSDAQIAFWAGFEFAVCGLHNGNIRAAWNDFKGSEQFKRLTAAPALQVSVPVTGEPSIKCWSCHSVVSLDDRADADGNCPHCRVELDLEEYLRAMLAAANPVAEQWVPVSERLPGDQGHDSEEVLCFLNGHCSLLDNECRQGGGWGIRLGYYDADIGTFRVFGRPESHVTHWMPLAAAPAQSTTDGQGDE